MNSSKDQIYLSIKKFDIGVLYIVQYELLKNTDFVGVIIKHPLTNECWMSVRSSKSSPTKKIISATNYAIGALDKIKNTFDYEIEAKSK